MKELNTEGYIALLQANEDPKNFEFPGGWNDQAPEKWRILRADFDDLVATFNESFGVQCEFDGISSVQDASYIGGIWLPEVGLANKERALGIRVSYFGRFVTLLGTTIYDLEQKTENIVSPDNFKKILEIFEKKNYVFIPIEILMLPYTGSRPDWMLKSWFFRYFHYS